MNLLCKPGQEYAHEPYGTKIAYASFGFLIVCHGYAETVPVYGLGIAVAQLYLDLPLIGYVVAAYLKV